MVIADAVRRALKKSKKSQTALGELWGTTPQVINNKMRLRRWTGNELVQIAGFTGGKLMFVYPDGEQIEIDAPETEKPKAPEAPKLKKAPAVKKAAPKKAPAQKKAPAKKKEPAKKAPDALEEQISFFD